MPDGTKVVPDVQVHIYFYMKLGITVMNWVQNRFSSEEG
jgi:hypothetical protein